MNRSPCARYARKQKTNSKLNRPFHLRVTFGACEPAGGTARFRAMARTESEAVERIEYDPPSQTLFVHFVRGEWYAYLDVSASIAEAFLAAPSHGRFFQDEVRDRYAYRRLDVSRPSSGRAGRARGA